MPFRPRYTGLINKYRDRLPVQDDTRLISLGEGNTPLIRLNNIPALLEKNVDIYVKYEGLNPSGSFKDRGMTMAVEGSKIVCTLTGHGLKDPDTAIKQSSRPLINVEAELGAVKEAILNNFVS